MGTSKMEDIVINAKVREEETREGVLRDPEVNSGKGPGPVETVSRQEITVPWRFKIASMSCTSDGLDKSGEPSERRGAVFPILQKVEPKDWLNQILEWTAAEFLGTKGKM